MRGGPAAHQPLYAPPSKLAAPANDMNPSQAQSSDSFDSSDDDEEDFGYQEQSWTQLRASIDGLMNRVNSSNIRDTILDLFSTNLIRGSGLFVESCLRSQSANPDQTDAIAAVIAVINSKFSSVGRLAVKRIVWHLSRSLRCNENHRLSGLIKFVAHLVNQRVADEILALEILDLLLAVENRCDEGVDLAVGFLTECGAALQDLRPKWSNRVFGRLQRILEEGTVVDKGVENSIEGLVKIREEKFCGKPAVRRGLKLVDEDDQITHRVTMRDDIDREVELNLFRFDPDLWEKEELYKNFTESWVRKRINGRDDDRDRKRYRR